MSPGLKATLTLLAGLAVFSAGLYVVLRGLRAGLLRLQARQRWGDDKRDATVRASLQELGYTQGDDRDAALLARLERTWPAARALPVQVRNRMVENTAATAVPGAHVEVMEFATTAWIGRRTGFAGIPQPVWQSLVIVRRPGRGLPRFLASARGRFRFIPVTMGAAAISRPEVPAFARRYRLQGEDEAAIRAALPSDVLGALADCAARPWVEALDDDLLFYTRERTLKPAALERLRRDAARVAALVP